MALLYMQNITIMKLVAKYFYDIQNVFDSLYNYFS
jgi:hypothetical protein